MLLFGQIKISCKIQVVTITLQIVKSYRSIPTSALAVCSSCLPRPSVLSLLQLSDSLQSFRKMRGRSGVSGDKDFSILHSLREVTGRWELYWSALLMGAWLCSHTQSTRVHAYTYNPPSASRLYNRSWGQCENIHLLSIYQSQYQQPLTGAVMPSAPVISTCAPVKHSFKCLSNKIISVACIVDY